jgi:MFS family permease
MDNQCSNKNQPQKSHVHYAYYILAACFLILFFNSGARFSIGVVFKPLISEFGWSRSAVSMAFFINMAVFALSLFVVGRFYDRYGPKWVIVIATIFLAVGFISIGFIKNFWQFILFYGIIGAIGLGGTSTPLIAALTSKWFQKRKGLAVSLSVSGQCLGQFALIPLFNLIVSQYNWRILYLGIGSIMLIVNIGLAFWVIRGDPDDLNQKPLGHTGAKFEGRDSQDLSLSQAMRTYSFWLFLLVMFVCGSGDFLVATHLIPFVTDHNISASTASNMLAWYGLMSLGGILVAGPFSDWIGNKIPLTLTFVLRAFLFLFILKYKNITALYFFAFAFGFTHLITAPISPILIGRLYGLSHLGLISGVIMTVHHLAGGLWGYLGGVIFDKTGSYQLAFILSLIMSLLAILGSILIKEKRHLPPSASVQ